MKIKLNDNYLNIKESYLFSDINKKVKAFTQANPNADIIRLGIGDVTLPLAPCVVEAMKKACDELGVKETFRGYPPEYGYDFLKQAVADYYKRNANVEIKLNEVFISDGAKSDVGNIPDIFGDNEIIIPDPVYPVYMDSNLMNGRKIRLIKGSRENGFLPMPNDLTGEGMIIYICSPNNPTGAVYDRKQLKTWVDFAIKTGSLIIFDSAYEKFVTGDLPRSIFEIDGARECAIEICSLSKTAGFTGTRCAWTIIPEQATVGERSLNKMWARRQATKFNGLSYPVQRGAEMALSVEGMKECEKNIEYYKENARIIADLMREKNIEFTGGVCSPYIWLKCPNNMKSWEFFDFLLEKANIVGTPGSGFGEAGEGYFRLTAFGDRERTKQAVERMRKIL